MTSAHPVGLCPCYAALRLNKFIHTAVQHTVADKMKPQFLNVDLEIKSSERLLQLEKELTELGAMSLFSGEVEDGYLTTFEVCPEKKKENTPDCIILKFSRLTKQFSEEAKIEWNKAFERVLDIGYESQETIRHTLKEETKRRMEGLKAIARITTYQPN